MKASKPFGYVEEKIQTLKTSLLTSASHQIQNRVSRVKFCDLNVQIQTLLITLYLLGLKGVFIFTPVYQPDCSSRMSVVLDR